MRHVKTIDAESHNRGSSCVIGEILAGHIPKAKQCPWRSVEYRSFADTAGSVMSVSGIYQCVKPALSVSCGIIMELELEGEAYRLSTHPMYMNGGC